MSKLATLIRRITRVEPAPMGFGSTSRKASPTMVLVALSERPAQAAEAVGAGADVVLLSGRPNEKELADAVSASGERACGLVVAQPSAEEADQLRKTGVDFLVVTPDAPASALQDQEIGLVLQLKDDLTDIQLRTVDGLPIEAIYFELDGAALTIRRQMELQRISSLTRKPLLIQMRPNVEQQDLLCLRDAGVLLAALDLKERDAIEALRRLRGVIDALPARTRRREREERAGVLLPRVAASEAIEDEEDDVATDGSTRSSRR